MKKKFLLFPIFLIVLVSSITACGILPFDNSTQKAKEESHSPKKGGEQSKKEASRIKDISDILEDAQAIEDFIEQYELDREGSLYTGSNPDIEIEVDRDGFLTRLMIDSEGLSFSGVEVGDRLHISRLDKKLKDYFLDDSYSQDKGLVYFSNDLSEDWYVFFRSKNGDEIDRIIAAVATDNALDELEDMAGLVEEETTMMVEETLPPESTIAPPITEATTQAVPQPQIIIQTVPVPQTPQTVYVPVPVGTDGTYLISDSSSRYLSDGEVNAMDRDFARLALNEIYARHGRLFNDNQLQAYFNSKSWYRGTISPNNFNDNWLSAVEKENVRKLNRRRDGYFLP